MSCDSEAGPCPALSPVSGTGQLNTVHLNTVQLRVCQRETEQLDEDGLLADHLEVEARTADLVHTNSPTDPGL